MKTVKTYFKTAGKGLWSGIILMILMPVLFFIAGFVTIAASLFGEEIDSDDLIYLKQKEDK